MSKHRPAHRRSWRWALPAAALLLVVAAAWALWPRPNHDPHQAHNLPAHLAAPVWMKTAPKPVQEAYAWAAHHQAELQYIPCYCGCGNFHRDNFACFYQAGPDGTIAAYDDHAYGCQICVDIARQVMQDVARGKPLPQIRSEIDAKYQARGLSPTPTPLPPRT
jgi:hypothetical protein